MSSYHLVAPQMRTRRVRHRLLSCSIHQVYERWDLASMDGGAGQTKRSVRNETASPPEEGWFCAGLGTNCRWKLSSEARNRLNRC
jgi:hypothetical protein